MKLQNLLIISPYQGMFGSMLENLLSPLMRSYECSFANVSAPGREAIPGTHAINEILNTNVEQFDTILILDTLYNTASHLLAIKEYCAKIKTKVPKTFTWLPVECTNLNPEILKDFDCVHKIISFTNFGQEQIYLAHQRQFNYPAFSISPVSKIAVLPMGINTGQYFKEAPIVRPQHLTFLNHKRFENAFIFLLTSASQYHIAFEALANVKQKQPNIFMWLFANYDADQVGRLIEEYDIAANLILSNQNFNSLSAAYKNSIYNATHAGININLTEAWPVLNIEHAATGKPQLTPNFGACREVFKSTYGSISTGAAFMFDDTGEITEIVNPATLEVSILDIHRLANEQESASHNYYEELSAIGKEKYSTGMYNAAQTAQSLIEILNS